MKIIYTKVGEELDDYPAGAECECGKVFPIDPCTEENLVTIHTLHASKTNVCKCPRCGKIDPSEVVRIADMLEEGNRKWRLQNGYTGRTAHKRSYFESLAQDLIMSIRKSQMKEEHE